MRSIIKTVVSAAFYKISKLVGKELTNEGKLYIEDSEEFIDKTKNNENKKIQTLTYQTYMKWNHSRMDKKSWRTEL